MFSKSLHHLKQDLALKEAARVVKPNGVIIIIEPVSRTEYQRVLKPLQDETDILEMTADAIVDSGLKIVDKQVVESPKKFIDLNNLLNELDQSFNVENKVKLRDDVRITLGNKVDEKPLVLDAKLNIYRVKIV